ncbi:MAG: PAS domain S-box protein [Kiritimatiellia bacterium]|nr:PAS domain S-box protein [Kiritimatiellia bacterium]
MGGRRIFIVEDERIVALDLQDRLTRLGHKIVGNVASGDEALKQIGDAKSDLVLTDIKLGGDIDGIGLADAIHSRYGVPVIFLTAYSDDKTLARVKATNACGFIIKPFTDEELQATIDISLHEYELEARLKQSEEQYRCLFDNAPVGYHEIDLKGRLTRINRTELEMLGYEAADMIGRPVWDFGQDKDLAREAVIKKLETGKISSQPFERNYLRRDGRTIPVLVKDDPIRSGNGELRGIRSTIQDISLLKEEQAKRKRLEASLRQAEKLESISAMAGGLAHELNNQLMAIQGNAALALINQSPEAQEARGYLQSVLASCQRSTAVMKQLLICAGMIKGEFKPVSLSEIVSDLFPSLKKAADKNVKLWTKLAENLPPITGDAGQLKQLLTILVANAGEAVKDKGGVVQIETGLDETTENHNGDYEIILRNRPFAHGQHCYLSIIDNGQGMNEETRARLFDPFFTTKGVGRGLGLSAALGIIKNHDGDILVKSGPGSGTTVRILFACSAAEQKNKLNTN